MFEVEERELTPTEKVVLLDSRRADLDPKVELTWARMPPPVGISFDKASEARGFKLGLEGALAKNVPISPREAQMFGFNRLNLDDPMRVMIALLSIYDLTKPPTDPIVKRDLLRARDMIVPKSPLREDTLRAGYRRIGHKVFGRTWDKTNMMFRGGDAPLDILHGAVLSASVHRQVLLLEVHAGGDYPRTLASHDHKRQDYMPNIIGCLHSIPIAAVIDGSCNFSGEEPDFHTIRPYFGICGPTSLFDQRKTAVVDPEGVKLFQTDLSSDKAAYWNYKSFIFGNRIREQVKVFKDIFCSL